MESTLLSICISSYNHGSKCVQLVKKILSIKDKRYNIFICDDNSDEETILKLKTLMDHQVTVIFNKRNVGPCQNWYRTIDSGNGKYILHILDRDDVQVKYLKMIMDILEKNSVGAGYCGRSSAILMKETEKKTGYAICGKGREAFLTLGGVPVHPTGFVVEKKIWKQDNYKKFFYDTDKYGIYPHSYVLGIIAVKRDLLFSPVLFYQHIYRSDNKRSGFYKRSNNSNYWWLPRNIIKAYNCLILYLVRVIDDSYKGEFICKKFSDGLDRATLVYRNVVGNQQEMERYGLQIDYISPWELLIISIKYKMIFTHILKKIGMNKKDIRKKLDNIWRQKIVEIIKEL